MSQVACLNEAVAGSAKNVFRAWFERLQVPDTPLDSNEDDAELLITIPFNGAVKIKAISIIGGSDGTSPSRLRAYTNRNDLDFATVADMAPTQAWDLQEQQQASMEYPTQYAIVRLLCMSASHLMLMHEWPVWHQFVCLWEIECGYLGEPHGCDMLGTSCYSAIPYGTAPMQCCAEDMGIMRFRSWHCMEAKHACIGYCLNARTGILRRT